MNLAIRGIDAQIAHGDTFHNDRHPDLKADYVLANPPFNDSDWRGDLLKDDKRWVYGVPPAGNANFAWVQHFISSPCAHRAGRLRAGQRLDVVEPVRRRGNPQEPSSRPIWWIAWWRCRASSSTPRRFRSVSGSSHATKRMAASATGAARRCSSTPARWAR